ncbi:unnamed protein product [Brassica oleracea var. botrytis]
MKMQVDFYAGRLNVTVARSARRIGRWIDRNVPAGKLSLGATVQWPHPRNNPAAVLALCYDRRCILIQLRYLSRLPKRLLRLLRSPSVTLAGIWNGHDGAKLLQQNSDLQVRSLINLRNGAGEEDDGVALRNLSSTEIIVRSEPNHPSDTLEHKLL